MKQANDFAYDMLDLDIDKEKTVYCAGRDAEVSEKNGVIILDIPFAGYSHEGIFKRTPSPPVIKRFFISGRGTSCLRFTGPFETKIEFEDAVKNDNESPMLCFSADMDRQPLMLEKTEKDLFLATDKHGNVKMTLSRIPHSTRRWSDLQGPSDPMIQITLYPDGVTPVTLAAYDQFFPGKFESMPLAFTEKESLFSISADGEEHFYGTGERFGRLDLAGRTITLENTDALGTDSRKAYKNIPFYLSSRGYGLFIHSSAHMRFSFADISHRAVQCSVANDKLDLFFIAGNAPDAETKKCSSASSSLEQVLFLYRGITGFSPSLPLWSYGMWMSRMTYVSADEIRNITDRLRKENYPCDVIHIDTGYFETDWVCDWDFSKERFPNPKAFIEEMRQKGIRICLWQTPNIGKTNKHYKEGVEKNYLPQEKDSSEQAEPLSDFSGQDHGYAIDFSNPEAVSWYKNHLRRLLDYGVSAIKTDFGERINMSADYRIKPSLLHNLYGLLYQKAAWEASAEFSDCPLTWSRAGWAGCQRYPLHWGGDTSATWGGLAQTLRGGLSLGLSGFTYWSHDIPGFHGLPDFMNSKPSDILYLRWTQFGVFTSHMRYHGSYPREPWEYPSVANTVRAMLRLRYALIPYIMREGGHCGKSGRALITPLLLDYPDDPSVWTLDTQYLFGRDMLVAPIMNDEGIRDIYLPKGEWLDFFTGKLSEGPGWIKNAKYELGQYPVFVKKNAVIPLYPEIASCTDEIELEKIINCAADSSFKGIYDKLKKLFMN
ncbi:MAG: alpha-xylosidase [Treponema sp.]|jgi:alpha-D-xyloside xylohydrolase|nr:alpha-xylosidase [Treponema sp.]